METRIILEEIMDTDQGSQPRVLPCLQRRLNKAVASSRLHPTHRLVPVVADVMVVSRDCSVNRPWANPLCSKMTESVIPLISPWEKGSTLDSELVIFVQGEGKYKKMVDREKVLRMRKMHIPHQFNLSFKLPNANKESCKHQLTNSFFCFDG